MRSKRGPALWRVVGLIYIPSHYPVLLIRTLMASLRLEFNPILQGQRDGRGKAIHEPRNRRSLFGHGDEDLAWNAVFVEANRQVTFLAAYGEMVSDGLPLVGQPTTEGLRDLLSYNHLRHFRLLLLCLGQPVSSPGLVFGPGVVLGSGTGA